MRAKTFFVYLLMCVVAFSAGLVGGYYYMTKEEPQTITAKEEKEVSVLEAATQTPEPVSTEEVPVVSPSDNGYLLTLDEGGIKVYRLLSDGRTEFLYKKEADINQLRQEDYTSLCKGITVKSESEARSLLEDFLS